MGKRSAAEKRPKGASGEKGSAAIRKGSSSTNPYRPLPGSQKKGFFRSRGTIKLLNMYKSKPAWLTLKHKGKKGSSSSRSKLEQPTAPARIVPDRRWFGNVRVIDQKKLALFREELGKAVHDPYSVVLRRSKLPLSLLAPEAPGKTFYNESNANSMTSSLATENEEQPLQRVQLKGSALLALQTFSDTFGSKSHRKRPQLRATTLESLAYQAEKRGAQYLRSGCGKGNSESASATQSAAGDDDESSETTALFAGAPEQQRGLGAFSGSLCQTVVETDCRNNDDDATAVASEEIFKKGTSKRIWGELYKVVDASDVLVEVLDARDPLGTRCTRLEQYLCKHKQAKQIVLLLNKVDLIPSHVARGWVHRLSKEAPTLLFQAKRHEKSAGKLQLLQLLRQYAQLMSDKKHVSVGFIGYPNVGKSSIINALRSKRVCAAAPVPGHTRVWQYVALTRRLYLIDCPGIVPASDNMSDALKVLRGVVRPERIQCPEEHIDELLRRVKPDHLRARYGLSDACVWQDGEEFLKILAKKKGRLRKGGEPDISITARIVFYDLQRGRLPYFVPVAADDVASIEPAQVPAAPLAPKLP